MKITTNTVTTILIEHGDTVDDLYDEIGGNYDATAKVSGFVTISEPEN